jgi:hypothetical protein
VGCTTTNIIEKIKNRLKWIETPMLLDEFEKKLVEVLTQPVWGRRLCETVEIEWDEEPVEEDWKRLGEKIEYFKEHHLDVIVCDGKKYELEAEYEYYYTPAGDIVHSFKVKDVRELKV